MTLAQSIIVDVEIQTLIVAYLRLTYLDFLPCCRTHWTAACRQYKISLKPWPPPRSSSN